MLERTHLFNTSMEAGLRSLCLLVAVFPNSLRTGQLVALDHILVHSRDFDPEAPDSLHPASPYRRAEPIVRRALVNRGVDLMVSRGLMNRLPGKDGFAYAASEEASSFLAALQSSYWIDLLDRTRWAAGRFGQLPEEDLVGLIRTRVDDWVAEFSNVELPPPEAS
ncbi:ABC-three component system middle component 2 [Hyphomicrobium sp. CS1BSMeth3]|jgi:hypothetical protein|uniref:ABC-three component system middle component 2 n=1 Tax=Hyphomicrobium sp. CS1BSMeth3 TaxID=1892844 RepID=UPI00093104AE|nr:ABC-three component system middle component 2 [Hyphomicrobium sp. CS1BSMeth3]